MKYRTIIEYSLDSDGKISDYQVEQEPNPDSGEYDDLIIVSAICLHSAKKLQNSSYINEFKREHFDKENYCIQQSIQNIIDEYYLPQLEDKEWENILAQKEIKYE